MLKKSISSFLLLFFILQQQVIAQQTSSYYFTTSLAATKSVATNGGNITATINTDTGLLSAALTPAFLITTNSSNTQTLTMSATATTTSGSTNAIFNIGTSRYIVLTNNTIIPAIPSVNDIKSGTPTAVNNPNAIAYAINDPATATGLTVSYDSTNKNWQLSLKQRGQTQTSITIPISTPLSNTFSTDDEAGSYKATITLSFN